MSLKFKSVVIAYVREGEPSPRLVVVLFNIESSKVKMWKASVVVLAALVAVGSMGAMVGAPVNIDVKNESVKHVLNFSVGEHNRRSNDLFLSGVAEVLNASKQVCNALLFCQFTTIIMLLAERKVVFLWLTVL